MLRKVGHLGLKKLSLNETKNTSKRCSPTVHHGAFYTFIFNLNTQQQQTADSEFNAVHPVQLIHTRDNIIELNVSIVFRTNYCIVKHNRVHFFQFVSIIKNINSMPPIGYF